jgi:hypothetical protein
MGTPAASEAGMGTPRDDAMGAPAGLNACDDDMMTTWKDFNTMT